MKPKNSLVERQRLLKKIVEKKLSVTSAAKIAGVTRTVVYRWLKKYEDAVGFRSLSKKSDFSKILKASVMPVKGKLSRRPTYLLEDKIRAIEAYKSKTQTAAAICNDLNISKTIFYRWLKRYHTAGTRSLAASGSATVVDAIPISENAASILENQTALTTSKLNLDEPGFDENRALAALENKIPRQFRHPKQTSDQYEQLILDAVSQYPELSAHELVNVLPTIGTKPVVGNHGVQNVLRRRDLNTYEKRALFALSYNKTPFVFNISFRTVLTMFSILAKLPFRTQNTFYTGLISFFIPVTISVMFLGMVNYFKIYTEAASFGVGIGYVFASLALTFGMFFFLYSAKYYISVILVLIFSRQILPEKHASGGAMSGWNRSMKPSGLIPDLSSITLSRQPFVSIHLPLYNEKRVVNRLLDAVTSMDYENFEVIVCDDSTDETKDIVNEWRNHPKVKISHRDTRVGFKGAALKVASKIMDPRTEFVIIFDADFLPYPDSVTQFLKYFQTIAGSLEQKVYAKSKIAAVQGYQWHVLNKSENWITRGVRSEYAGSYVIERSSAEIYGGLKQIAGSVYMIRNDVMQKMGWGDSITEDFEMTLRLYSQGYRVAYTPYIQTPSECVSTLKRLVRQRMRWAEGHSFNIKKHFWDILKSKDTTLAEKVEIIYLTPYYLQSFFFLMGTLSWFIAEAIFQVRLPFWTAVWGWSLVLTNMLSLPLMNLVGMFLEEAEEKDFLGLFSFIMLTYIVAPFQAYAAVKGFIENSEGPWFRTPKTGRITDTFKRGRFYRWLSAVFPTSSGNPTGSTVSAGASKVSFGGIGGIGNARPAFLYNRQKRSRIANVAFGLTMTFTVVLSAFSPFISSVNVAQASTTTFKNIEQSQMNSILDPKPRDESADPENPVHKDEIIRNATAKTIDTPRTVIKKAKDGGQIEYIFHQEPRVRIKVNGAEMSFETDTIAERSVRSQKSTIYGDNKVLYEEVLPGIDIRYTINGNLITEEYIVKNSEAASGLGTIVQKVQMSGLTVVSSAPEAFAFYFPDGTEALTFGNPFATDANGDRIYDIKLHFEKNITGYELTKQIGSHTKDWLTDPNRAFPVSVDPTVVVSGGVDETETQFGSLQRKIAYVSSNWYAFYNVDGKVYYKKSADGITWGDPVDLDSTDSDNYNTSISVSTTAIFAFWVDNGADRIEGRRIDTSSSDTLGTLCQTSVEAGAIDDSFMVSVAGLSTVTAVVAYSDTDADTEVNAFSLAALDGSCTGNSTSIITGNITFGSGITSLDRPVLVPFNTDAVDVIFQDGNLSYSRYILSANEWVNNNVTIASVTHNVYSVVNDGTTTWILALDTTQNDDALLYSCCTNDISNTEIDADAGSNGQDVHSDIDIFCVSDTDCKIVYTDNIDSTGSQDLVFVDCDDATCSSPQSFTIDSDLDADTSGTSTVGNPAIYCTSTDDCKVVYQDNYSGSSPDAVFYDCDDADGSGDNVPCDDGATATPLDSDTGGTTTLGHFDLYCVSSTECAVVFFEDNNNGIMFVDCENDECSGATPVEIIDIGTTVTGSHLAIYCASVTDCKVVAQDTDAGTLVFVNCSDGTNATNDEGCIGITPDTIDAGVGTVAQTVPVAIDCVGGEADCRIVYQDYSDFALKFLDCNDTDCDSPSSTTIDSSLVSTSSTTHDMYCPAPDNCKIVYKGHSSISGINYSYFVDCDNNGCSSGSVIPLEFPVSSKHPRSRLAIHCPASDNCKMASYEGGTTLQPTVNMYDCDTESCLPTSTDLADPWTGETNVTGVSLTYDSTNTDLIASAIMDSSEQAYYREYDLGTSTWATEYTYGLTAGNLGHISAPYSVAGLTQMGVVYRQGTNFEFSTLPENMWVLLLSLPVLPRIYERMKRKRKRRSYC